jgi:hypothetical protein
LDSSTYKSIAHITAKTIENRINVIWKKICHTRHLSLRVTRSFTSNNTALARFYHLIKTHKSLVDLKVRPIVSSSNSPTERISWLLSRILTPLLSIVPAHLESSSKLIERLNNIDATTRQEHPFPFSLDVVALYTSIPVQDAIDNLREVLQHNQFHYSTLCVDDICDLLQVVLTNTYFVFYRKIFQQIKGLPMGSNVSPILAIIFMDTLERRALLSSPFIGFYSRYIDDIFCLTRDRTSAENFLNRMNSQHYSINFEDSHHESRRNTHF